MAALNIVTAPSELDLPGFDFHELQGNRKGTFALTVRANWRVTFKWDSEGPYNVWRIILAADRDTPGFKSPHPGDYLREDILPSLGMTITDLADHLGVSRASLSELVNANRSVSLEMAQRLGQAFRNGTRFWLALQMQRDIWLAEQDSDISVKPVGKRKTKAA